MLKHYVVGKISFRIIIHKQFHANLELVMILVLFFLLLLQQMKVFKIRDIFNELLSILIVKHLKSNQ
jgi:hypothetical protein